jgi:dual specificity phosphatase 12
MKWMEPQLEGGALAGKIVCPNKRCGAKLGNFDWAGVCCSCKEWVVPVSNLCEGSVAWTSGLM